VKKKKKKKKKKKISLSVSSSSSSRVCVFKEAPKNDAPEALSRKIVFSERENFEFEFEKLALSFSSLFTRGAHTYVIKDNT